MDKARFIQVAPLYYALAIVVFLRDNRRSTSKEEVKEEFSVRDYDTQDTWCFLEDDRIFDLATSWLVQNQVISVLSDDFGPSVLEPSADFAERSSELSEDTQSPFYRFKRTNFYKPWLNEALKNLAKEAAFQALKDEDFSNPDREWEPIPLDRSEPKLTEVIESVEEAIKIVSADNGYAANRPEERNYVVDGLHTFWAGIKERASISLPYIRQYAIDPVFRGIKTLGQSAGGVALELFKLKLKEWLLSKGISWF